ncbi:MAG TPA: hypothetical protein VEI02_05025 [Planctomycetota bacterium]|nr:hypothetical protein [Planctomycetota bacterium]
MSRGRALVIGVVAAVVLLGIAIPALFDLEGRRRQDGTVRPSGPPGPPPTPPVAIKSRLKGSVTKLEKGRVYALENGQVWRQTSEDREVEPSTNPTVWVFGREGALQMLVEGARGYVDVERVE